VTRRRAGSLIPHAGAIRALVVAMIEAAFRTDPMAPPRGVHRGGAGGRATRRRAIGVAPITRGADREEAVAAPTDFLAKRRVHDVGAAVRSDWTRHSNRGTRETTGSVAVGASRRSPRVWRIQLQALTSSAAFDSVLPPASHVLTTVAVDAATPVDAQNAPTGVWKSRTEREIPTASTTPARLSLEEERQRTYDDRPDYAVSGER